MRIGRFKISCRASVSIVKVNCLNKLRITLKGVMREVLKDAYSAQQQREGELLKCNLPSLLLIV